MASVKLLTAAPEGELRARFVAAARSLVNTPYRHRGRNPATGLDCSGLVIASAALAGFEAPDPVKVYGIVPEGDLLEAMFGAYMVRLPHWSDALPGDVVTRAYAHDDPAKHCGIVTSHRPGLLRCLHASRVERKVADVRWFEPHHWRSAFRLREIAAAAL